MYEDLVKRLRNRANGSYEEKCEGCEFTEDFPPCVHCTIKAFTDAADAIEELSKYVNTIRRLKSDGWYLQQAKNHDGYEAIATMPLPEPPEEET